MSRFKRLSSLARYGQIVQNFTLSLTRRQAVPKRVPLGMGSFFAQLSAQTPEQKYQSLARARGVSEIGNSIRQVILALAILSIREKQHDLFISEVLESCGFFFMSMLAPFFIDQMRKIRALIWSDILCLINAGILIVGVTSKNLMLLWVGSFFMTFIASLYSSVLFTVTAQYSGSDKHQVRAGLSYLQRNILLGGLVGLLGTSFSLQKLPLVFFLYLDAATFLFSTLWIYAVTRNDLSSETSMRPRFESYTSYFKQLVAEWRDGFQKVVSTPELLKIFGANFIICLGYGVLESTVVSTQKLVLGFSHGLVIFSRALNRLSAILGSVLVGRWSTQKHQKTSRELLNFGFLTSFLGTFGMLVPHSLFFVSANTFYNFGWSSLSPTLGATLASHTPQNFLGRVQAFRSLVINFSILLGNLLVLALGGVIPLQWFFAIPAGCFLITLLLFRNHTRARAA